MESHSEINPQSQAALNPVQLQNDLAAAARALEQVDNIGVSQDIHDIFYLIDFLVYLVDQVYPFIPCPSGCSNCCVDSGLPRTSALEWEHIHRYISTQMPAETLRRVIAQNEARHRPQLEMFLREQDRIESPDTDLPLPAFGCKECPFLLEGRCSIYPVRPAICRGFGYFTWRPGKDRDSQVFACQMAADTLLDNLRVIGAPYAALPAWNPVSDKVYQLNQKLSTGTMATLPLWLMAHCQDGQLLPLDLVPDFKGIAKV
ncbi:MAG: YkgJ family cysteine cluster protein [Candidatus Sericytochromatia bacterium]